MCYCSYQSCHHLLVSSVYPNSTVPSCYVRDRLRDLWTVCLRRFRVDLSMSADFWGMGFPCAEVVRQLRRLPICEFIGQCANRSHSMHLADAPPMVRIIPVPGVSQPRALTCTSGS